MKTRVLWMWMIVLIVLCTRLSGKELTADKIIQKIVTGYKEQMKGINDITIVTDKYTSYQKRATVGGRVIFKTRNETDVMGSKFITIYDGVYQWNLDPISGKVEKEKLEYNPYQMIENLKTADVEYAGTKQLHGRTAYILKLRDITKLIGMAKSKEMVEGKVSGKVWVDVKDLVTKKLEMDTKVTDEDGQKRDVKITISYTDHRKIDGMLIPYKTVMTISGIGEETITPEQRTEMQESLAEMQSGLEKMPPGQRAMAEQMMKPQIEMMQKMLAGGGIETVTEVKDVKINTDLSDALFDGNKLR